MAAHAFGGARGAGARARLYTVVNVNSPLLYDERHARRAADATRQPGQPVIVTPFLLMGAMSPVSIPAALVQQTAEALAGVALTQLVRPGTPVVLGSFLSHTDMQSGSPGFGGPESAIGLLGSGQIARRYGLPWRSGGGALTCSQIRTRRPPTRRSTRCCRRSWPARTSSSTRRAGWSPGLVACFEKFVVDIEIVRMLREEFTPLEVDEASLAFGAHREVGHGGHFLGAEHTLERFRDCFYRPLLSTPRTSSAGRATAAATAPSARGAIWRAALERYEQPPIDAALRAELEEFVDAPARRARRLAWSRPQRRRSGRRARCAARA